MHKGASKADHKLMDSIPHALSVTDNVCSSVNVGSTRAGINMDAVLKMAGIIKATAEATADRQCIGAGKLVVFCNAVEDNPFMAGAFHGSGEADEVVNVGVSGPGVVRAVLADLPKDADITSVAEAIKATAFKASSTCRWHPPRLRATRWPRSSRPSAWASAADRAPRQRSPC